jgi:uncharacterized protein YyaL (SSP411 family)
MSDTISWHQWSREAFALALDGNKPILLSLVTAWSEGCATMDRMTFSHPDVVASIRERFVAVRVDADRRPDVNERYNLGGWPTTAFLTTDGEMLSGATFLNPEQMIDLAQRVADAWRDRRAEIQSRVQPVRDLLQPDRDGRQPDTSAVEHLRSLIVTEFDSVHGGFGTAPKFPHTSALRLALSLSDESEDPELTDIVELTLDRIPALWDPVGGGYRRYAGERDWSDAGVEKTLEGNAALLHLYIEASIGRRSEDFRARAAEIVRWVKSSLADETDGGFYNAQTGAAVDGSMYVDGNAGMVAAFLRSAALFDDPWLRDFALKSLERVILPGYAPGNGVAHLVRSAGHNGGVRGLLTDQIRVASALIWAHAITEQLPYSMLAAELTQFAIRTMWDDEEQSLRDRASFDSNEDLGLLRQAVRPFDLNCEAACVLDRLATLTGEQTYRDRAIAILGSLAPEYRRHGLLGAPYAMAVREVIERHPPLGLGLAHVDWHLETDGN